MITNLQNCPSLQLARRQVAYFGDPRDQVGLDRTPIALSLLRAFVQAQAARRWLLAHGVSL